MPIPPRKLTRDGFGIVVCEPVVAPGSAPLTAFGAGCARWLQFNIGGLGALGGTPLWTSVDRAEHELGRQDLRLTLVEALRVADMTGTTYVGIGEITGGGARIALSYRVYRAGGAREVGTNFNVAGTQAQIVAALPALARKLATLLGVRRAHLPDRVEGTGRDLAAIGSLPWLPSPKISPTVRQTLAALAVKAPLAGMLALRSSATRSAVALTPLIDRLLKQVPGNAIAVAETGWEIADILPRYTGIIRADRKAFPQNYLFALTDVWLQRNDSNLPAERLAAEQAVANAPRNPDAWLTLGQTYSNAAEHVRRARYISGMKPEELAAVDMLYPKWIGAVRNAATLDPLFGNAWLRVAEAAAFTGQRRVAENAFWKAEQLDNDNPEVYNWGLQMFQPKWGGDRQSLNKFVDRMVTHYDYGSEALLAAEDLRAGGFEADAKRVENETIAHNRERLRKNSADFTSRATLAWAYRQQQNYVEAENVMREQLRLDPNNARAHYILGKIYKDTRRTPTAVTELEQAVRLQPDNLDAYLDLAYLHRLQRLLRAAEENLKSALLIRPNSGSAWTILGDTYMDDRQPDRAVSAYRRAVASSPENQIAWRNLSFALSRVSKFKAAVVAGENAERMDSKDIKTHYALSYAYAMNGQPELSAQEARLILAVRPDDLVGHLNLGEALMKLGRKAEAKAELTYVMQRNPPPDIRKDALEHLSKNP